MFPCNIGARITDERSWASHASHAFQSDSLGRCSAALAHTSQGAQYCNLRLQHRAQRKIRVPGLHVLHHFIFVEHHPPRGRLPARQQHSPRVAWPMLPSACRTGQVMITC